MKIKEITFLEQFWTIWEAKFLYEHQAKKDLYKNKNQGKSQKIKVIIY